ncbi:hypothetical protein ACF09H_07415, partial [Streptomyces sp. NPDC014983]|uniref:hypothetical protein n=1 Tax=Streptomyces sp. NPDC014983 TaxID=3364933 RepID=UPI0037004067
SSATSPRPRPGSGINTPSRHNERVSKITGKLHKAKARAAARIPVQPTKGFADDGLFPKPDALF